MKLREHLVYEVGQDLFAARVRGRAPELVVNYGYQGVLALGCVQRAQSAVIAYPHDDFAIYTWAMSPGGDVSYAFAGEPAEGALRIDHVGGTTTAITLPASAQPISELCWFSATTLVLDYGGTMWTIASDHLHLASDDEVRPCMTYFYRRLLSHYVVVKTDPYLRGVYVRSKDFERKTIGFMPFDANESPLLAEQDGTAVDTAYFGNLLFVSFESQILVQEDGDLYPVLTADEGELWVRVNTVEHEGRGYLTVVSSSEDHLNPARGRVTVYEIITE
jgi:hypothetical protein